MNAPVTTHLRIATDPRGFAEFAALSHELDKLSHPACPDVDWVEVERLCLSLFQQNGADVQTAAAFTLARGHLCGLAGLVDGVVLLQALIAHWSQLWPPMAAVRLDVLNALFTQLPALLRGVQMHGENLPSLVHLDAEMQRLQALLIGQAQQPLAALQRVRQQIAHILQRVERSRPMGEPPALPVARGGPLWIAPVVILPAARSEAGNGSGAFGGFSGASPLATGRWRRWVLWGSALLVVGGCLLLADEGGGLADRVAAVVSPPPTAPQPVRLDSLSLFEPGSAVLKPDSTKVLINTLVGIKAQPGWLIVIAGHTDASGEPQHNQLLSLARATAVKEWMQRMGDIPDSCFAIQGMAAGQPVAGNDSEAGRAANRRVDIQIVPQMGACSEEST
jgi:type VI secretion system protein VasL